jgi:hypothetical protein
MMGARDYLVDVAQLTQEASPFTGGDVAQRLGKPVSSVSEIRARLLAMGALTYDGRQLAFATPGMAEYVLREAVGAAEPPLRNNPSRSGERPVASPESARYVAPSRVPADAGDAARLRRAAQPKPPSSTGDTRRQRVRERDQNVQRWRPTERRPSRGRQLS